MINSIKFSTIGIILGLIFIGLILLLLNQLKILSLFPESPQTEKIKKTQAFNPVAEKKAKKAGYTIFWQGDLRDETGRTILASEKRIYFNYKDVFGWSNGNYNGKGDFGRGIGTFKGWEDIQGSNDFYVILEKPEEGSFKARILVEKSKLSSPFQDTQLLGGNRTRLEVEDLATTNPDNMFQKIGDFYNLDQKTLDKLIKPGDIVVIYPIPLDEQEIVDTYMIKRDENRVPVIVSLIIRRFGGKAEIDKELNSP